DVVARARATGQVKRADPCAPAPRATDPAPAPIARRKAMVGIGRREFIAALGGAAAWPLAAHAQQGDRVRRIGVLMGGDENDPEGKRRYSAFTQALAGLGWTEGRNLRIDFRWSGSD